MKTDEQKAVEAANDARQNIEYRSKANGDVPAGEWKRRSSLAVGTYLDWSTHDYRIAPESPESPPARGGFQVGVVYRTVGSSERKVVANDGHPDYPLISRAFHVDGELGGVVISHGVNGIASESRYSACDLILHAAKKKVALTADDVPDGAVFLSPSGMKIWPNKVDSSGVLVTVFESGPSLYPWGAILKWHYRSATTGGEWTGCWKEIDA